MAGSVNKVILIGNLGKDPEIRSMQTGGKVANLTVATSETWKDKATGEKKDKTEWHRVVVFNEQILNVCENYLKKGAKVYIEGELQTRKWQDQSGQDKYSTEVVLRPYRSTLTMLDSKGGSTGGYADDGFSSGGDSLSEHGSSNFGGQNFGGLDDQMDPFAAPATFRAGGPGKSAARLDDDIPF